MSVYLGGLSPGRAPRSQRRRQTEQWSTKHAAFQMSHCLRPDVITWAESVLSGFTSGLRPRELSLLIKRYAYLKQVKRIDPTFRTAVLQIDQEFHRCPTGLDVVPCVCPQGAYWITSVREGRRDFWVLLRWHYCKASVQMRWNAMACKPCRDNCDATWPGTHSMARFATLFCWSHYPVGIEFEDRRVAADARRRSQAIARSTAPLVPQALPETMCATSTTLWSGASTRSRSYGVAAAAPQLC